MKVICIDDKPVEPEAPSLIKEGQVYEVVDCINRYGSVWYELDIQSGVAYNARLFIPLSSIDETTFERNYNKELV